MKKYIVLFLVCAMFVSFVPNSAKAYTTSDLYKKIQELSTQVTNLQSQMSALVLKAVSPVTSVVTPTVVTSTKTVVAPTANTKVVTPVVPEPIPTDKKYVVIYSYTNGVQTGCAVMFWAFPPIVIQGELTDPFAISGGGCDLNGTTYSIANPSGATTTEINRMIVQFQQSLIEKGLLPAGSADGKLGPKTIAALKNAEKGNKTISVPGITKSISPVPFVPFVPNIANKNKVEYSAGFNCMVTFDDGHQIQGTTYTISTGSAILLACHADDGINYM